MMIKKFSYRKFNQSQVSQPRLDSVREKANLASIKKRWKLEISMGV